VYNVMKEVHILLDSNYYFNGYYFKWHMGDISLHIVLTGTCSRHVPVNKPKHTIVYWHFLCVILFKSSLNISVQFYL